MQEINDAMRNNVVDGLPKLIERYKSSPDRSSTEADVTTKLVLPLLELLGWNRLEWSHIRERGWAIAGNFKALGKGLPDIVLMNNGKPYMVIEVKSLKKKLLFDGNYQNIKKEEFEKVKRHAKALNVNKFAITNFAQMLIWDKTRTHSDPIETFNKPDEYIKRATRLYELLGKSELDSETAKKGEIKEAKSEEQYHIGNRTCKICNTLLAQDRGGLTCSQSCAGKLAHRRHPVSWKN